MRFARSGTNWEGRRWILNGAVQSLAEQIEAEWPENHPADGTVASRPHDANNPNSDHRPRPFSGPGVVDALDMGEVTEDDGYLLAEQLRLSRDPRLKYVIHERRIFSSYSNSQRRAWEWGPYSGANAHLSHVHVSVVRSAAAGPFAINLGDNMDHLHEPMPSDLPRAWADATWARWVERSGTIDDTRGHTFYREDLSWVYDRVIKPLEQEVSRQAVEIAGLEDAVAALAARVLLLEGQAGGGPHNHDSRYLRAGQSYRIG